MPDAATTDTVCAEIQAFYDRYITAWNAQDFEAVAACYAEPAMFLLPTTTASLPDRAAMIAMLKTLFARLNGEGFSHTEVGSFTVKPCGEGMAIADARDAKRLRADGTAVEVIDAHYVLRKDGGDWRFAITVTCEPGWNG